MPDGRLNLTAAAPLTNWISIPAVLVAGATATQNSTAVFFPSGGRNHRQYSVAPTHGGMARLSWPGWLVA